MESSVPYIICFYWEGDRWQREGSGIKPTDRRSHILMQKMGKADNTLPEKYINNLYRGVERFVDRPFKFVCFTNCDFDLDEGIEIRDFNPPTKKGVLPRIWMFSPEAGLAGHQVLCLDLDVVIVDNLKPLLDYNGIFAGRGRFKSGYEHQLDGDIMSFKAGEKAEKIFWNPFIENVEEVEKYTGGRERYWIRKQTESFADFWNDVAPDAVVSYKWHVQRKNRKLVIPNLRKPPEGASIVSCHGVPRPHRIDDNWIKEYWK